MDTLVMLKNICDDDFEVQFEVLPSVDASEIVDERKRVITENIEDVENELESIQYRIDELNTEIDKLTNHADGIDYMVAVGSGIIAGVIDIFFVDDFSLKDANKWGDEKTQNFVIKTAQKQGYQGDDLYGAVKYLEEKYPIAADKATNDFGGGRQHHLRDYSHHPTPIGLLFSVLTQLTHKVYGTDVTGIFKVVELKEGDLILIGKNLPEKVTFGVINWFFHMVSDMAGSSYSIGESIKKNVAPGLIGTGLPGLIGSFLKEISALPIFRSMNENGYKEFSVWVSKLFNGTLLGERDENGKLIPLKFDLRTEIGVAHQLKQQALPVIINECIVRGFYFIRRFYMELKANNIQNIKELGNINWKNTLPFKDRTVIRMLTISTGTMTAIDLADAAIESAVKSGGVTSPVFLHNMIVKVNFVGVGRFAIAVGSDISMGVKRTNARKEKSQLMGDVIRLSNSKLYYKAADSLCSYSNMYEKQSNMFNVQADVWVEVEKTQKSMEELYMCMEQVGRFYLKTINEIDESFDEIERLLPEVEKMNPGLTEQMLRRLK